MPKASLEGSFSIEFPTNIEFQRVGKVDSFEILTEFDMHEMAIITFVYPNGGARIPTEGTPIKVTYGGKTSPGSSKEFAGYVNHHTQKNAKLSRQLTLYCVDAALPADRVQPGTWNDVTSSYIARVISDRYGLRPVITKSTHRLETWSQGTKETDFQMLKRLAKREGLRFWTTSTSLYFVDANQLLTSGSSPDITTYRLDNRPGQDTLIDCQLVSGSMAPGHTTDPTAFGQDQSGVPVQAVASPEFFNKPLLNSVIDYHAVSGADAQMLSDGARATGIWSQALATLAVDDAGPSVGDVVNLAGLQLDPTYQGLWLVSATSQHFSTWQKQEYATGKVRVRRVVTLKLVRNNQAGHFIDGVRNPSYLAALRPDIPSLTHSGRWVSSIPGAIYL